MAAVDVEDDYWECECGHINDETDWVINECEACGKWWE